MDTKLYLIRGKRIEDQLPSDDLLSEASTVNRLASNIKKLPTKKRQLAVNDVRISNMVIKPFVSSSVIQIHSTALSNDRKYETIIMFRDIEFENESTPSNVTFTGSDDVEYNMPKIRLAKSNVRVKCNCMDFYWRFSRFNGKDMSLYGPPPTPAAPKTDRASDNKKQVPGVCKHLLKSIENLRSANMIT